MRLILSTGKIIQVEGDFSEAVDALRNAIVARVPMTLETNEVTMPLDVGQVQAVLCVLRGLDGAVPTATRVLTEVGR